MKTCCDCKDVKAYSEFALNRSRSDGRQEICRTCDSIRGRAYRQANKAKEAARCKRYREANPDKQAVYVTQHREQINIASARYVTAHPERHKCAVATWAKNNRPRLNAADAKRRALKLNATPAWVNPESFLPVYEEAKRKTAETGTRHEVDHIVPLQGKTVVGLHVPWNLRVIPRLANRSKGNKLIVEMAHALSSNV